MDSGFLPNWAGGVYFGDAKSFADLVTFWNLRAAGTASAFAHLPDPSRFEEFIRAHLKVLDEQPNRTRISKATSLYAIATARTRFWRRFRSFHDKATTSLASATIVLRQISPPNR